VRTTTAPRLVLLHGVGLDQSMWSRCAPVWAEHAQVLTPDLPGHGRSAPRRGALTVADLANGVADALEDGAHLVGFSLGALVAEQLALTNPDRVHSLVLVSAVARRDTTQRTAVQARYATAQRSPADSAHAAVRRWFGPDFAHRDPELMGTVLQTLLANDVESYLACYRVFAEADATLWPQLGQITAPTLVVTGANDGGSTPAMTAALAAAIPHATARVIADAGHLLPLEQPAALSAAVLDHLSSVPTALQETP